jgi:hypothetical protein
MYVCTDCLDIKDLNDVSINVPSSTVVAS